MDGMATGAGARLLIVDDEPEIAAMLAEYFTMRGYTASTAANGPEALDAVAASIRPEAPAGSRISVILLDVNMPGMDGFEVCRRIRSYVSCPIIFLTARVEDMDQLDGFAAGADDYVFKPFSLEVLERRVAAHLARDRRQAGQASVEGAVRFFGPLTIDYAQRTVTVVPADVPAVPIDFTRTEFDIVALLSKRPGRVFDREAIYREVWGWDAYGDAGIIREHIRRIRRKLADAGVGEPCIETMWGAGYKWVLR